MKERNISLQLSFEISSGGRFVVPDSLFDKKPQIVSFLEGRKLWKQRPKGDGLLVEMAGEEVNLSYFNTSNWQIMNHSKESQKIAAFLIIGNLDRFNKDALPLEAMKKGAVFYVFEGLAAKVKKEPRLQALRDLGMVETAVLNSSVPGFCVWEGRSEKQRKGRAPVDLLDKEKRPRAYNWAHYLWEEMARNYKRFGFEVVSDPQAPIVQRLKNSKNPPEDFSRLKMGWGVEIKNNSCGCHARVDLNGNVDWIYFCGEESHHNLPER